GRRHRGHQNRRGGPMTTMPEQAAGAAAVVRLTTVRARPGAYWELQAAAQANAADAVVATGCLSAEACQGSAEDEVVVVSRWRTARDLEAFLAWHESAAHQGLAPHAAEPPHSQHLRVSGPEVTSSD